MTKNKGHQLPVINIIKKKKKQVTQPRGAGFRTREVLLDCPMVLTPAPYRHELDDTCHATFLYTTARLHSFSMQLPTVQEGPSIPEAVLLRSWERTRRAPRPQLDGGDAHRAMLPLSLIHI